MLPNSEERYARVKEMRERLEKALDQYLLILAELDSLPPDQRVRTDYNVGGVSFSWNAYRNSIISAIHSIKESLAVLQAMYPYEVYKVYS
jgi:hypothetical protein